MSVPNIVGGIDTAPIIRLPNGQAFQARGVNVKWLAPNGTTQQGAQWVTNLATAEPLTRTLPGINMVRIAAFSAIGDIGNAVVADMKPFIDAIIAQGIVVVIHCNISSGTLTGGNLTTVTNWYADCAVAYASQTLVWFETQSCPTISSPDNDAMLTGVYNAVRGAGNESMFLVASDITIAAQTSGYTVSTLAGMRNYIWDHHFFNAASNYSADQDINNAALTGGMNALWQLARVPIIIGEFGDASDGQSIDVGWQQTVQAVYDSNSTGFVQAWWNTTDDTAAFTGNQLLALPYDGTQLTQAGSMLRNAIVSGS